VGEQRRDIIPKILMDPSLSDDRRIQVDELVVYGTGVMESFEEDFTRLLQETEARDIRWVVVFSPTGCKAMLCALNMLDSETGRVKTEERGGGCGNRKGRRKTYIATIGPTTRDYLRKTFGFEPDVCAEKPSPEGIGEGVRKFMQKNREC
jgi:uroporphyrinogen-III synthase